MNRQATNKALLFGVTFLMLATCSGFNRAGDVIADDPALDEELSLAVEALTAALDPAVITTFDVVYYIDYENGTITLGDLPIGARVVDPTWEWEFRTGRGYTREAGDETRHVTWLIVAKDHYDTEETHVTLLAEELLGKADYFSASNNNHWAIVKGLDPQTNEVIIIEQNFNGTSTVNHQPERRVSIDGAVYYRISDSG